MQINTTPSGSFITPVQTQHADTDSAHKNAASMMDDAIVQVFVDGFIARLKDDTLSGKYRTPQEW